MHGRGDGLRCNVPGCKGIIRALTGLQEIEKLRYHYYRFHHCRLTVQQALELRVHIEESGNQHRKGG